MGAPPLTIKPLQENNALLPQVEGGAPWNTSLFHHLFPILEMSYWRKNGDFNQITGIL